MSHGCRIPSERRKAIELGAPLVENEIAQGYHVCPLQKACVGVRDPEWGVSPEACRCGFRLPDYGCQCSFDMRFKSDGCCVCNPALRADLLPPFKKERWAAEQHHTDNIKATLQRLGAMDPQGRIRQWRAHYWRELNMQGHTSLNFEKCFCSRETSHE